MSPQDKQIWYHWKLMHFRSKTLLARLDVIDQWSLEGGATSRELDELNTQLAELEDDNEDWLPELIQSELG